MGRIAPPAPPVFPPNRVFKGERQVFPPAPPRNRKMRLGLGRPARYCEVLPPVQFRAVSRLVRDLGLSAIVAAVVYAIWQATR